MLKSSARMASSGPVIGTAARCLIASRIDNVAFPLGQCAGIELSDGFPSATVL
jgi:hypothetical protein